MQSGELQKSYGEAQSLRSELRQAIEAFKEFDFDSSPVISIITPVWNTKPQWFFELAVSILGQTTVNWQWCIVDDCSSLQRAFHLLLSELEGLSNVRVARLGRGLGISGATNLGLELATGEFVCFVDHDDVLARNALDRCLEPLQKSADAVYTDSDKIDENGTHSEPFYKPGWSPEYLRGAMYIGHLLGVRRSLAEAVRGFDSYFDGVQDFEFFLRCSEQTNKITHIPEVLYHWRKVAGSVAADGDAKGNLGRLQCRAVQQHLNRLGLNATAHTGDYTHRVKILPNARSSFPKVSIIIPTRDSPEVLEACLYSLFAKTTYPNFEVLCIDNETIDPTALQILREAPIERILFPGRFNYSKANNLGLSYATGDYFVFMNNDIEVITPDWIAAMLYYAEQPDVGSVGGLLSYPNRTVQHAGVVLGCRGTADHVCRGLPEDSDGYAGSLSCAHEVSAVTAACMMIPRSVYQDVGGFNEHFFTHYQDVDLCLKVRQKGKRIIYAPQAKFVHHESVSRGQYYDLVDRALLLDYWANVINKGDPYYNPNLNVEACDYSLNRTAPLDCRCAKSFDAPHKE
jgi:GT2 family glycosyltransferase